MRFTFGSPLIQNHLSIWAIKHESFSWLSADSFTVRKKKVVSHDHFLQVHVSCKPAHIPSSSLFICQAALCEHGDETIPLKTKRKGGIWSFFCECTQDHTWLCSTIKRCRELHHCVEFLAVRLWHRGTHPSIWHHLQPCVWYTPH